MKSLWKPAFSCPYCHQMFAPKQLTQKPFSGSLKPYQFTPKPTVHCPHCDGELVAKLSTKWLCLLMIGFVIMLLILFINVWQPELFSKWEENLFGLLAFAWSGYCALKVQQLLVYHKKTH
ncbi:hypothetical protein ACKLNO_05605 [Neisseriaceae bacterium B1]